MTWDAYEMNDDVITRGRMWGDVMISWGNEGLKISNLSFARCAKVLLT